MVPAVAVSVPVIVVPVIVVAVARNGKFWKRFGPECPLALFAVMPLLPRSMPSKVFEKIEFSRMEFPVLLSVGLEPTMTPFFWLKAMMLPARP